MASCTSHLTPVNPQTLRSLLKVSPGPNENASNATLITFDIYDRSYIEVLQEYIDANSDACRTDHRVQTHSTALSVSKSRNYSFKFGNFEFDDVKLPNLMEKEQVKELVENSSTENHVHAKVSKMIK